MANVIVDKDKLDVLANAISAKSGEPLTLTLDEMVEAVDGIEVGGGGITPTGNINITQAGVTDVTNYATATVPQADVQGIVDNYFTTQNGQRKWHNEGYLQVNDNGWIDSPVSVIDTNYNAIASGTSVTPTESAQTIGGASTMMEGAVTVNAIPSNYVGSGVDRRDSTDLTASGATVSVPSGFYENNASKAVASGSVNNVDWTKTKPAGANVLRITHNMSKTAGYITAGNISSYSDLTLETATVTPTTSSQTITPTSSSYYLDSVTVNPIPSEYIIPSGTKTIDSAGTTDVAQYASASVASGSATAIATKGAVSNHSVTVTPSVTTTAGYVTAGTSSGTAVSVSASELVSGSQTLSDNGTYDVTNLAEVVVDVQGGGGGGTQVATKTATPSTASSSIQFTGLSGNPTSFVVTSQADIATNTNGVTAVVFDGSSLYGQTMTTQVTADTEFTKSYSNGTLTITATSAYFEANAYKLVYTYGGSTSDIETADVQVGSGATSITFSVNGRPAYWSCIFKSDFSTSSGYQRVIAVANDGSSTYGLAMDSSAHTATSWTATYSGGNLTINSQGTNNGGYFHQPGYYQLTYYVDSSAPSYQSKNVTYTPTKQTQTQSVTADSGYDALEAVNVTVNPIPNEYIIPTGNLAITQNGNNINVSQYATVSVNVSGGGGDEKNTQVVQGTTRTTSSTLTAIGAELTVSKTGTYDVYWSAFRSSTSSSYTYGTRLYVGGTAYGTENTTWSNHVQNNHLTGVSLTANQKVRVYGRNSRGSSYYIYAPTLVIVET